MEHLDDVTFTDITEIVAKDYYSLKKPSEFQIYDEQSEDNEDTVTRMVLEAQ